jgi:elongation factor P--(R)-beta-lysine ligase
MLSIDVARFRARLLRELRSFFDELGYLEVDTPILAPELIPEAHIEVFATELIGPGYDESLAAAQRFLVPSPEIWMKRLLARGYGDIYYLGKVFRNAEISSRIHHPEFTMLEWYTTGARAADQAERCEELLARLCRALPEAEGAARIGRPVQRMTVAESFARYAGAPSITFGDGRSLREAALRLGLRVGHDESEEDLFQRIFLTFVEPNLPADRPVILCDYPALVPTLATTSDSTDAGTVSERWELYLDGMELANCYTEERDRRRLERFLARETERKRDARVAHPSAESLLEFAAAPECSGVALGVDRLIMALLGLQDIRGVIFFP